MLLLCLTDSPPGSRVFEASQTLFNMADASNTQRQTSTVLMLNLRNNMGWVPSGIPFPTMCPLTIKGNELMPKTTLRITSTCLAIDFQPLHGSRMT